MTSEICPACGVSVEPRQRFCHECGARLGADEGAERRLLTALRCDLLGREDRLGHERDEAFLEFVGLAGQEIGRYGGAVVDRAGTSLTALIGVPLAREDHAQRAVLCAMALRQRLSGVSAAPAFGVSTGEAVVGMDGARIVSVVGAPIDDAVRLSQRAEPGSILIASTTEEAVRGYVTCRALPHDDGQAPAFVVTGRGQRVSRLDRADRRITRFVGRSRQLVGLSELLDETLEGRGQVIGVAADAGMGKSRLVAEFLAGPAAEIRVREGRCLSYAAATPFVPVADILRGQAGVPSGTSEEELTLAVESRLVELGLDPGRHSPCLTALLGSTAGEEKLRDRSPEAVREMTLDSLVAVLVAEAAEAPTIILLEDLHWIDPVSQEVIGRFVEALPGRRVLILTTYRPGFAAPWMGVSYATQLSLPPLSVAASREVVESIVGDLTVTEGLIDAAIARADGNPFFLEELSYAVAGGALGTGGVPATVHDVLLARIDQLGPAHRRLLRTASVLGREFPRELLAAIWDGGDLDDLLEELRRREFLFAEGNDRDTMIFRHALTHDVAYAGLLADARRTLHRSAGEALERIQAKRPDESYALLGYHFSRAGEHLRAVEYLSLAAEKARQAYSNESAADALELALSHIEQAGDDALRSRAPVLVFRLAFTLYLLGRFRDALTRLESPLAQPDPDDAALVAEHDFWLSYFHTHLGHSEAAHQHARRAIASADGLGDRLTAGRAFYVLTREDFWLCRFADGVENGRRAVELLESSPDWWWWLGHASSWKGLCHLERGEFDEALQDCERMNAIGAQRDDPRLLSYSDWNLGWIEATRGNAAEGIAHCSRSLQRSPDPLNSAYSAGWLGFSHREAGDHAQAITHLERSIEALRGFGYSRLVGWFSTWLADAYLTAGRRDDARRVADEGLSVSRQVQYPWAIAVGTRAMGRIAEADGDAISARKLMSDALHQFNGFDSRFDQATTHLDLARLERRMGDKPAALAHARSALSTFESLATPVYQERARRFLADLSGTGDVGPSSGSRDPDRGRLPSLVVRSLGGLELARDDGTPVPLEGPGRELVAMLLAARGVPAPKEYLARWLWPSRNRDDAVPALDDVLQSLARVLGIRVTADGAGTRLTLLPGDTWDVRELLEASTAERGSRSADELALTIARHGAPPFPEWHGGEWLRPLAVACGEAIVQLRGLLAGALLDEGRLDEARVQFTQLLEVEPEEEAWHRGLMRCHAAEGEIALALRQYHACRSTLRQARSADPSPETQELYLELLRSR